MGNTYVMKAAAPHSIPRRSIQYAALELCPRKEELVKAVESGMKDWENIDQFAGMSVVRAS
jgi:hypothetical protein